MRATANPSRVVWSGLCKHNGCVLWHGHNLLGRTIPHQFATRRGSA